MLLYPWLALTLLLFPFLLLLVLTNCCFYNCGLTFVSVLDGTDANSNRRCISAVLWLFAVSFTLTWSAALQLSTRWAAALYVQAGESGAVFASVYATLLVPLIACIGYRAFKLEERCVCLRTSAGKFCCFLFTFLIGFAIPLVAILIIGPVSGSEYVRVLATDFSIRNSRCYFQLVYSNEYDSLVGFLQRIGF